jgi:hypothetical protein
VNEEWLSKVSVRFEREDGAEFLAQYINGSPLAVVDGGQWRLYRLVPQKISRIGRPVKHPQMFRRKRLGVFDTLDKCRQVIESRGFVEWRMEASHDE